MSLGGRRGARSPGCAETHGEAARENEVRGSTGPVSAIAGQLPRTGRSARQHEVGLRTKVSKVRRRQDPRKLIREIMRFEQPPQALGTGLPSTERWRRHRVFRTNEFGYKIGSTIVYLCIFTNRYEAYDRP